MQAIKIYVSAANTVGAVRDYVNAKSTALPALVRGIETCLKLRLFATEDGFTPYPIEQLSNIAAWKWVMDRDYDGQTAYILEADNENISVASVTDMIGDTEYEFTEISVPLSNTNTVELNDWLGNEKSKSNLTAELVGYDAEGKSVFVLQIENFTIRNRLTDSGDPTEIDYEYLTEAQVRAVITGTLQNPVEFEFSADGINWHAIQDSDDLFFHLRISGINADWSGAIRMLSGKDGYTPVRGVDFWTDADKVEIQSYIDTQLGIVETQLAEI